MGNSLKKSRRDWMRMIDVLAMFVTMIVFTWLFFPYAQKSLTTYSLGYYNYTGSDVKLAVNTATMKPAVAVPMLMYHGVIDKMDDSNTTIDNFIKQMEMLKREGYTTITLTDYDLFRQGKFVLPPKPIVITFDDGRKDSYYTTDDVLKKLGFKATLFVATEKALEGEPFYLSWNDMKTMIASGRWEIEAHGRKSHEKIPIDNSGDYGRYLTSRMYLTDQNRLETEREFEVRVEQDYINNLKDLKDNLGVTAQYLAIPLNDYGQTPVSNEPEAPTFNQKIIEKYFRLALIEANNSSDVLQFRLPIYNFKDDPPYRIRRIEVKNMAADTLNNILDKEFPQPPELSLTSADTALFSQKAVLAYGLTFADKSGLHLKTLAAGSSGKVIFGDKHWGNYEVTADIKRQTGRSVTLLLDVQDEKNYISFGLTDNGVFLRQTYKGKEIPLINPLAYAGLGRNIDGTNEFRVIVNGRSITGYLNGHLIFSDLAVPFDNGALGFKVWSDQQIPEGILQSLKVVQI